MKFTIIASLIILILAVHVSYSLWRNYNNSKNAKRFKTKSDAEQILVGLKGWYDKYGKFPFQNYSSLSISQKNNFYNMLIGDKKVSLYGLNNHDGIRFISDDIPFSDGKFYDDWGEGMNIKFLLPEIVIHSFGTNCIDDGGKNDDIVIRGQLK